MELRQLKYFVAIVESASISKAAAKVHVAQSALSLQISHLEEAPGLFTPVDGIPLHTTSDKLGKLMI